MFGRKKKDLHYLRLNMDELRLLRLAMIRFRNRCLELGKPTEDIDEILIKILD